LPAEWRLLYQEGESWKPVETEAKFPVQRDGYCHVDFKEVRTTGLRVETKLQPQFSAGILEWKIR
jgi:hypothetical protein